MKIKVYSDLENDELEINTSPKSNEIHCCHNAVVYNNMLVPHEKKIKQEGFYDFFINNRSKAKAWPIDINNFANKKIKYLKGTYLFALHPYADNYSHFTRQSLYSFILAERLNLLKDDLTVLISANKKFQRELIELFNINKYDIMLLSNDIIYVVENLIYSDSLFGPFYDKYYVDDYEDSLADINPRLKQKIYITRKNQSNRPALNEDVIIDFLKKKGFEIYDFDKISVKEQIFVIRSAKIVVAAHGASGANLLYHSNERFQFVELFNSSWVVPYHTNFLVFKNCDYSATINKDVINSGPGNSRAYKINLELLNMAIEKPCVCFNKIDYKINPIEIQNSLNLYIR